MKHIKRILLIATGLFLAAGFYVLFARDTGNPGNYPAVPDTPEPEPHKGLFMSSYGSMEFNGNGTSVLLDLSPEFSELSGLPVGRTEGNYAFLSGDLPPQKSFEIRYDAAHEMRITAGEDSVVIDLGIVTADGAVQIGLQTVTPERIPLVLFKDDKPVGIIFELQK